MIEAALRELSLSRKEETVGGGRSTFAVAVAWLKLILEITGAAFVGIGRLTALSQLVRTLAAPGAVGSFPVRLQLAKS